MVPKLIGLDRAALVLYGTETGTAQDLAEEVGRITERLHFFTDVRGLDSFSADDLSKKSFCVFVISTTGQGDFPTNARKFWTSLLKKKLPNDFLDGLDFALVGLGDSSYPKFNWAGRKLRKRLNQLGGHEITESCEADEQGEEGTDGSFLIWSQSFRISLLERYPLEQNQQPIPEDVPLPNKWRLQPATSVNSLNGEGKEINSLATPSTLTQQSIISGISFSVTLDANVRVTPPDHWQDVRSLKFTTDKMVTYLPGDALAIMPENSEEDVDRLIQRMNWLKEADSQIELATANQTTAQLASLPVAWPSERETLTLRDLLTSHLDIMAVPRRSFFSKISEFANDQSHKDRLVEFADYTYLDEYFDYATRPRRSIVEILQEFDSVRIPWQEAINVLPPLRPRQFSIASGGSLKKNSTGGTTFELLVAIVKYRTVIKKIREGVCTRYLAALPEGSQLNVTLRTEGRFYPSKSLHTRPYLLIGAGTGIAPLRSLIHETHDDPGFNSEVLLIFGARNACVDFFFKDEWNAIAETSTKDTSLGKLQVITAFSRDQREKIYVQDRIGQNGNLIFDYLHHKNATIVVCGSSGLMPKAVRESLVAVLSSFTTHSSNSNPSVARSEAEAYLELLEKSGRYKQETW